MIAELPTGWDEEQVARFALERSIRIYPMRAYRAEGSRDASQALVLGYGGLSEGQLRDAVRGLAESCGCRPTAP